MPAEIPATIVARNLQAALDQRGAVLNGAAIEKRGLTPDEAHRYATLTATIADLQERKSEIADLERRTKLDNAARAGSGIPENFRGLQSGYHIGGGTTYHRGDNSPSFFRDLIRAKHGDANAADRLRSNNVETGFEARAMGNTGGTGGSGGEFSPPDYLVEEYVKLARPGRVTADLFTHADLPSGVSSIVIPKVLTGSQVGPQPTQNTALMDVDPTTAALASGITTTGGKVVVSRQLLDQSPIPFDKMILGDLAADHARQIGSQAIIGSGVGGNLTGYLTPASTNVVAFTSTTPTAIQLYQRLAQLQGAINASRFRAPTAIVMHPRRWSWFASYVDSSGRPLVSPTASSFNSIASMEDQQPAAGHVGNVLGVECFVDANIPITLGVGANQDTVLMGVMDDVMLWESPIQSEAFEESYADSMGVLFRCFNYASLQPSRYLASLGQIQGTGLTPPVFA
jgi:HK97 family phage major capsid protein